MKKILFIESSPRKTDSITSDVANRLIKQLKYSDEYELEILDLWNAELPHMNGSTLSAKYAIFSGSPLSDEQNISWQKLNEYVKQFANADLIIMSSPMWNWGIPYVLKHYIDVITQPGLTFNWTPEDGYIPLLPKRDVVVVTSSGGDYTKGSGLEHEDFAYRYLKLWLEGCMGSHVNFIHMTMTATGQDAIDKAFENANYEISQVVDTLKPAKVEVQML